MTTWKACSTCKKPISHGAKYFICSVSTCNGLRTGYRFCTLSCFEAHLPGARHRQAGAVEQIAPHSNVSSGGSPTRRIVREAPTTSQSKTHTNAPKEVLIVASKLKDYVRLTSNMNTSAEVMDVLSSIVRKLCDQAIESARQEGRKTVLSRDFRV